MKIKTLKFLFGIFFLLGIGYMTCVPILLWQFWTVPLFSELTIALNVIIILVLMYVFFSNSPRASLHQFYDYTKQPKGNKHHRLRFQYRKQDHEFSCGQAVMQMKLERYGIFMSQDEIMQFTGDKNLGTSHWEIAQALNEIFSLHQKPLRARIYSYSSYALLEKQVLSGRGAIVLFMSKFNQQGFTENASYPHFALLSYISLLENKVILTTPSSEFVNHGDSEQEAGELVMTIEEFHHRFYAHTHYLKCLEYKPTMRKLFWRRTYHRFLNLMFRGVVFFAYYTKILKPGIAIIIEPVKE